ncbi:MAG: ABC transporter permease, partial [Waddliaceae bacterium]|nr:ABC transporter permease [Waddliaceae bacterium]
MYKILQLIKLGARNIFRNKRRTFLTATVIGIGLAALIFLDAYLIGMKENITHRVTTTFLGEAQVHAEGFRLTREVENTVNDSEETIRFLEESPAVAAYTMRAVSPCMLTSPRNASSVALYGIDTDSERKISSIHRAITSGVFLDGNERAILLGYDVAEDLDVAIGDHIVVTVAQAHTGDLMQDLLEVSGIFNFGDPSLDKTTAFVVLPTAQKMLGIGDDIHEIAILFDDTVPSEDFFAEASAGENEALGWKDLMPSLSAMLEMIDYSIITIEAILFTLVIFIIMNTLFMSIFERTTEFGILRAIGTRPLQLFALIIIEAGALAALSVIIGTVIGMTLVTIVGITGISYAGLNVAGVTFS